MLLFLQDLLAKLPTNLSQNLSRENTEALLSQRLLELVLLPWLMILTVSTVLELSMVLLTLWFMQLLVL